MEVPKLRHWFDVAGVEYSKRALLVPSVAADKVPTDDEFAKFLRKAHERSVELNGSLYRGDLSPREWADAIKELLNDGHASAWVLGRQRAGDLSAPTEADELVGIGYADGQADFLLAFMEDIENGRYTMDDGTLNMTAIQNRMNLYVQNIRGTSGASFVANSPDDDEFTWELGGAEDHCDDCPELNSLNPWTQSELYAFPGDGNTACLGNCLCRLVRQSDGRSSFAPVSLTNASTTNS